MQEISYAKRTEMVLKVAEQRKLNVIRIWKTTLPSPETLNTFLEFNEEPHHWMFFLEMDKYGRSTVSPMWAMDKSECHYFDEMLNAINTVDHKTVTERITSNGTITITKIENGVYVAGLLDGDSMMSYLNEVGHMCEYDPTNLGYYVHNNALGDLYRWLEKKHYVYRLRGE